MELMSSLRLLCVLAAALPAALGISGVRLSDYKLNTSVMLNQNPLAHKILLNINGPPLVKVVTELQSVFRDIACRNCNSCMERAIKAHRTQSHVISNQPNVNEMFYNVIYNRKKRNTVASNDLERKLEKGKTITATVTRYLKERKVIAIEVQEINEKTNTCKVYSVRKSLACDSVSDVVTKKKSKKIKKIKEKNSVSTERVTGITERAQPMLPTYYKKREVDNFQVIESFMPSIEELY